MLNLRGPHRKLAKVYLTFLFMNIFLIWYDLKQKQRLKTILGDFDIFINNAHNYREVN